VKEGGSAWTAEEGREVGEDSGGERQQQDGGLRRDVEEGMPFPRHDGRATSCGGAARRDLACVLSARIPLQGPPGTLYRDRDNVGIIS
jgi:hypothetical protein